MKIAEVLRNALRFSLPTMLGAAVSLFLLPVLSRVYAPQDYGLINLFYSSGNILLVVVLAGMDNALIRYYHAPLDGFGVRIASTFCFGVSLCSVVVLALVANVRSVAGYLDIFFGEQGVAIWCLLLAYTLALVIFRLLGIHARQRFDASSYNVQQMLLIASNRFLYVLAVLASNEALASILLMTTMTFVFAVLVACRQWTGGLHACEKKMNWASMRRFVAFGIPTMPSNLMLMLNPLLGKVILVSVGKAGDAGVFAVGGTLANAFSVLPAAFAVYWSPFMYANYEKEQALICKVQEVVLCVSGLIVVTFVLLQDALYMLIGHEYRGSQAYFMLLMLFPVQALLTETVGYGMYLKNKTLTRMVVNVLAVLGNVAISLTLVGAHGALGVATGLAVSSLVLLSGIHLGGQRLYRSVESNWRTALDYVLIAAVCFGNVFLWDRPVLRLVFGCFVLLVMAVSHKALLGSAIAKLGSRLGKGSLK